MRKTNQKRQNNSINLMSPIGGDTLGVIGINLLKGFRNSNIDVSLFPIPVAERLSFNDQEEYDISLGAIRYSRNFDYNSPTLKIWYSNDLAIKPGNGEYFALVLQHSNNLTSSEIHNLKFVDGIFCHSEDTIDLLKKHKINKPIHKINLGVNTNIFGKVECEKTENDTYIFYSVGRWSFINGHDILIECFNRAFTEKDNVALRLLPYNEFLKDDEERVWIKLIDESKLKDKITIYNRLDNQYAVANFIADASCLVSLNRVANSGLNILEAISMNKPIIYTNIGLNKQYDINNYPVYINDTEPAYDNRILFGESDWAKITENEKLAIISQMQYVFNNKIVHNNIKFSNGNILSWDNTAKFISNIMLKKTSKNRSKKTTTKSK